MSMLAAPSRSRLLRAALLGAVGAGGATGAAAQTTVIDVSANIVPAARSSVANGIDFGPIVASPGGGTVTLTPVAGGGMTVAASGVALVGTTADRSTALIYGTTPTRSVRVRFKALSHVLTRAGGGATMALDQISISVNGDAPRLVTDTAFETEVTYAPPQARYDIRLGGRLTVGPNQLPGVYSGTVETMVIVR